MSGDTQRPRGRRGPGGLWGSKEVSVAGVLGPREKAKWEWSEVSSQEGPSQEDLRDGPARRVSAFMVRWEVLEGFEQRRVY